MKTTSDKEKNTNDKTPQKSSSIKVKLAEKILKDIKKDAEKFMRETGQGKY